MPDIERNMDTPDDSQEDVRERDNLDVGQCISEPQDSASQRRVVDVSPAINEHETSDTITAQPTGINEPDMSNTIYIQPDTPDTIYVQSTAINQPDASDTIYVTPNGPPNFRIVVPFANAPPNGRIITFADCVQLAEVYVLDEPRTLKLAMSRPDWPQWKSGMDSEYRSLIDHDTITLVRLPEGKVAIDWRWVYKRKYKADGTPARYKARLVAKGFTQQYGIDYYETFAPVARAESIRIIIIIAVQRNMHLHQMDVITAFLNGFLDEEIYMKQPHTKRSTSGYIFQLNSGTVTWNSKRQQWHVRPPRRNIWP